MICQFIKLENFRNIISADVSFSPGLNILYGNNAQGKTNLLEAMYTFSKGKSFRGAADRDMVRFGERGYFFEIGYTDGGRDHTLTYRYYDKSRARFLDGYKIEKLYEMIGNFRAVLFCPEHMAIVKGAPGERRAFVNVALSQFDREYLKNLSYYDTLLENRNALLRNRALTDGELEAQVSVWSEYLAGAAAYIAVERERYAARLEENVNRFLSEMTGQREKVTVSYKSDLRGKIPLTRENREEIRGRYFSLMTGDISHERYMQSSLYGIHKDDFELEINGAAARSFASQGQQRSLTLALKLAEGEISKEVTGEYPVFLFDDVLSELDRRRREYILKNCDDRQVIITACEAASFRRCAGANVICVKDGQFQKKKR